MTRQRRAFDQLNKQSPDSPSARQARFAKGLSLARKGDFRAAELVYRAEAQYLFSEDRKQEIANLYLEYADTYFKPPKEDQKPDYEKALEFYGRALSVGPKLDSRVRVELLIGQCQQKLNKLKEAAELYRKFLREHVDHPLVVEARFRLGETLLADNQRAEAREAWQDLLDLHKGSASDLLPQAAFRMAETLPAARSGGRRAVVAGRRRAAPLPGELSATRAGPEGSIVDRAELPASGPLW